MRTGRCRSRSSIGETEVRFDPCRRTCGRASVPLGTRATVCAGPPRQTGRSHPVLARPRVARPSPDGEGVAGGGRVRRPISSLPHAPMATSPSTLRTTKRSLISWRRCRLTSVPCHPSGRVLVLAAGRAPQARSDRRAAPARTYMPGANTMVLRLEYQNRTLPVPFFQWRNGGPFRPLSPRLPSS